MQRQCGKVKVRYTVVGTRQYYGVVVRTLRTLMPDTKSGHYGVISVAFKTLRDSPKIPYLESV